MEGIARGRALRDAAHWWKVAQQPSPRRVAQLGACLEALHRIAVDRGPLPLVISEDERERGRRINGRRFCFGFAEILDLVAPIAFQMPTRDGEEPVSEEVFRSAFRGVTSAALAAAMKYPESEVRAA